MKFGVKKIIKVTKKDIQQGVSNGDSCPVALALLRAFKATPGEVNVNQDTIELGSLIVRTPKKVSKFIDTFDEESVGAVKPFEFELKF